MTPLVRFSIALVIAGVIAVVSLITGN